MRTRGFVGAIALFVTSAGLATIAVPARAEQAAPQPNAAAPEEPRAPSPRGRAKTEDRREQWWARAREVLFDGIALSEDQAREVDAIIAAQRRARQQAEERKKEAVAARKRGDTTRAAELRTQLRKDRKELQNPHARLEQMRALLEEEQRSTFDMNRARLMAEGQGQPKQARRRAKRSGTDEVDAPQ